MYQALAYRLWKSKKKTYSSCDQGKEIQKSLVLKRSVMNFKAYEFWDVLDAAGLSREGQEGCFREKE